MSDTKEGDLFRELAVAAPLPSRFDKAGSELLRERRSVRRYASQPVPDAVIEELLYAATCAPSAHNRQPWRFALLKDAAVRRQLASAMGKRLCADRTRDGDPPEVIADDVARSIARISAAPLGVVVCLTMEDMDAYPDERRTAAERQMAVQGAAMAMQNMLLAAHAADLGASIMCAPLFCAETVRSTLDLPAPWEPQALVTLGYPAGKGKSFQRRPLVEVVRVVHAKQ